MVYEKVSITLSPRLYNDIQVYCEENDLKMDEYVEKLLKKSFNIERYGSAPPISINKKNVDLEKKSTEEIQVDVVNEKTISSITVDTVVTEKNEGIADINKKIEEIEKKPEEEEVKKKKTRRKLS